MDTADRTQHDAAEAKSSRLKGKIAELKQQMPGKHQQLNRLTTRSKLGTAA